MTETETKSKFESPYKGQDLAPSHIQVDIGVADNNLIRAIRPRQGTLQITAQHLWSKLCNELRKRQITGFDSVDEFEQFLTTSILVDCGEYQQLTSDSLKLRGLPNGPVGGTTSGPGKNSNKSNDGRRAKTIRPGSASKSNVVSDLQSGGGETCGTKSEQSEGSEKGS